MTIMVIIIVSGRNNQKTKTEMLKALMNQVSPLTPIMLLLVQIAVLLITFMATLLIRRAIITMIRTQPT